MEFLNRAPATRFIRQLTGPLHRQLAPVLLIALSFLFPGAPAARAAAVKETDLKAVFLYNFAQFVEWPPAAFRTTNSPLVIGILGTDPFGKSLDEVVKKEVVGNRQLTVERYRSVSDIAACHILFISSSEAGQQEQILSSLKGRSILTVGETEGFARGGGMIRFITVQNKIRLRINNDAAKAAHLTLSSKLLRAAHELVESPPK